MPTTNHSHPLHVENRDSESRLVVEEYFNDKLRLECCFKHNYFVHEDKRAEKFDHVYQVK